MLHHLSPTTLYYVLYVFSTFIQLILISEVKLSFMEGYLPHVCAIAAGNNVRVKMTYRLLINFSFSMEWKIFYYCYS